jgi:hypothetical protein
MRPADSGFYEGGDQGAHVLVVVGSPGAVLASSRSV